MILKPLRKSFIIDIKCRSWPREVTFPMARMMCFSIANGLKIYPRDLLQGVNNHGSGCAFSAGIAAELAKGASLRDAVAVAKDYLYNALKYSHQVKDSTRVIDHFWKWK